MRETLDSRVAVQKRDRQFEDVPAVAGLRDVLTGREHGIAGMAVDGNGGIEREALPQFGLGQRYIER